MRREDPQRATHTVSQIPLPTSGKASTDTHASIRRARETTSRWHERIDQSHTSEILDTVDTPVHSELAPEVCPVPKGDGGNRMQLQIHHLYLRLEFKMQCHLQ